MTHPQGPVRTVRVGAAILAMVAALALIVASGASAAGGATIASAPIVPFGVHEFGTTATGEYDCGPGEYWNVTIQPSDQITIDWETAQEEYAYKVAIYPVGTTDYSINNVYPLETYYLGNNNKAEAVFTSGTGGTFPIVFIGSGCGNTHAGPYDFTITDQRAILVSLAPHQNVNTNTTLTGTANLVNGAPVPDGLTFNLEVSWGDGNALYSATSVGGVLSFPLALPESAIGDTASFVVTRPGDSQYQAVKSGVLESRVAKPRVPAPSACELARSEAHTLGKRYRRLRAYLRYRRHRASRRLHHRTALARRAFKRAQAKAGAACR